MPKLRKPAPQTVSRLKFWTFVLLILGLSRSDILSEIDEAQAAGALTAIEAEALKLRVTDAVEYERTDPDVLEVASLLGVASSQEEIDELFRQAGDL